MNYFEASFRVVTEGVEPLGGFTLMPVYFVAVVRFIEFLLERNFFMALRLYITKNFDHMSHVAATLAESQIQNVHTSKQECVLGLATGSSPTGMYKHLAKACNIGRIDPARVRSFNLDEYVGLPGVNAQQRALHCKSYSYFMVTELFGLMPVKFAETFVPYGLLIEQKGLEEALENQSQLYELRGSSHGKSVMIRPEATGLLGDIRRNVL